MGVCVYGCMCLWEYVSMVVCVYGCMYLWLYVSMAVCNYGCMYLWLYASMAVCIYGCMHLWESHKPELFKILWLKLINLLFNIQKTSHGCFVLKWTFGNNQMFSAAEWSQQLPALLSSTACLCFNWLFVGYYEVTVDIIVCRYRLHLASLCSKYRYGVVTCGLPCGSLTCGLPCGSLIYLSLIILISLICIRQQSACDNLFSTIFTFLFSC